jgi:hypothetical protein
MSNTKGIVWAFAPFRETTDTLMLSDGVKSFSPAGDQFMGISLVTHVPNNYVPGSIKNVMQCQGQFNDSQIRRQMAAIPSYSTDDFLTNLLSQLVELFNGESLEILWTVYASQKRFPLLL